MYIIILQKYGNIALQHERLGTLKLPSTVNGVFEVSLKWSVPYSVWFDPPMHQTTNADHPSVLPQQPVIALSDRNQTGLIVPGYSGAMDPFKPDDDDEQSLSAGGRAGAAATAALSTNASGSPPKGAPLEEVEDPFVASDAWSRDPSDRSRGVSTVRDPSPSRRPVDSATASQLLSNNEAGPSRLTPRSTGHTTLNMSQIEGTENTKPVPYSAEEQEQDSDIDENVDLMGSRSRASTSRTSRRSTTPSLEGSSRPPRRRHKKGISTTLKAIGRRIANAAKQAQEADAHDRTGGPIHLASSEAGVSVRGPSRDSILDRREKALWMWANVENLDEFLSEMYAYYTGKGVVCIALGRALNLLTIAFVIGFSTFLFGCLDFTKARHNGNLSELVLDHCVSRFSSTAILLLTAFGILYGLQLVRFGTGLTRLQTMHHFFEQLLGIPDADIQTVPWHQVIANLSALLKTYPLPCLAADPQDNSEQSIDVHEAANRLMRQHNYLIALLDRNILNLCIPGMPAGSEPLLTKSLQWNLEFCLLGFLFDRNGNVRKPFLSTRLREDLVAGLRRRLVFMAAVNFIFAPFIVMYLLAYSFFRYFEEYHKNPAFLGSRQYTELARWKFREYNELPHLFRRRCHNSYPYAERYIQQFPREATAILARFVSFIAGSFAAVLVIPSIIDPDLFLHFDITPQRNVLFYVGVFGAILAGARGMIPNERLVFEPEALLECIAQHTHYCPESWKGRLHSAEVNAEFGKLYSLKLTIFIKEVFSVLATPFILCFSMTESAPAVIDFFREHTVHVDRLGYVCSFAVFDFARHGKPSAAEEAEAAKPPTSNGQVVSDAIASSGRDGRRGASNKMEQSVINFAATNAWQPDHPETSLYVARLQREAEAQAAGTRGQRRRLPQDIGQRAQFYDEAFERSMMVGSSVQPRKSNQVSAGRTATREQPPSAIASSLLEEDFVDPFAESHFITGKAMGPEGQGGRADGTATPRAVSSTVGGKAEDDEEHADLAAAGTPGPRSLIQHVQRRML